VRITAAAVLAIGLTLALGGIWLVRAHRAELTADVETAARLRSRDIAADVGAGNLPPVIAVPRGDENLVQVVDDQGRVVAASANLHRHSRLSTLAPGEDGYASATVHHLERGEGPFRLVARRATGPGGNYIVYAAGNLEPVTHSSYTLTRLLEFALPTLLLLVGVLTWFLTGRALRPVEAIRREVEVVGAEDLHRRVPEPPSGDEIARLARTMNAMLARLEDANDRQLRFVADASHELRSPLTGMRTQLEVDLEHPEQADWEATGRDVLADTVRLQRLVDDLLVLAVADESALDTTHRASVDLDEIVLSEARRLQSRRDVRVDTSAVSGAQVEGNADQLHRVVHNLLDNAARYAESTVKVGLHESSTAVTLTVVDDGPGIPAVERERVFERFARLDDAHADTCGNGLGLAIVREVVSAHGGSVAVENTPGAAFTVTLPI
jgi:signal transduction histidine kinase